MKLFEGVKITVVAPGSVERFLDQLGVPWAAMPNPGRIRLSHGLKLNHKAE